MVIGEPADSRWYYIQPKRLYSARKCNPYSASYPHAMCLKRDWDRSGLDQVVIYIPEDNEPITVCSDGNVRSVISLLQTAISKKASAQTAKPNII